MIQGLQKGARKRGKTNDYAICLANKAFLIVLVTHIHRRSAIIQLANTGGQEGQVPSTSNLIQPYPPKQPENTASQQRASGTRCQWLPGFFISIICSGNIFICLRYNCKQNSSRLCRIVQPYWKSICLWNTNNTRPLSLFFLEIWKGT